MSTATALCASLGVFDLLLATFFGDASEPLVLVVVALVDSDAARALVVAVIVAVDVVVAVVAAAVVVVVVVEAVVGKSRSTALLLRFGNRPTKLGID